MELHSKHSFHITPCTPADAATVSDVAIRSYKDFYLHLWYDQGHWYIKRSFDELILQEDMRNLNHAYFLLYEGNYPIGFLKLNIHHPLRGFEKYNCLELERIYIIKSASGKGYGRQTMEYCFEYALKLKKQIIWLKAMDSSPAVQFYERLGFEHYLRFRLDFHQMKEEYRGMVVMMKWLNNKRE